jgi:uncharacterized membrane protein YbaN (DUF454 family)
MDESRTKFLLLSAKFVYAKSMPRFPHWYTLRRSWRNAADFEAVVQFIRDHGKPEKFYGRVYLYFYVGKNKYWTMGSPLPETILINRAMTV